MLSNFRTLPNQLTGLRLLTIPAMWIAAAETTPQLVALGLIIALLTDMIDGPIARATNTTSDFGSFLDSLADQTLQLSAVAWVLMLQPEILSENRFAFTVALGAYGASLAVGLIKFRRLGNLHLFASKASGLLLYLFLIHAFMTGGYSGPLLILACSTFLISSAETLVLQLMLHRVDQHIGSLLFLYLEEDHLIRRLVRSIP
jgi:phosphatidylglycerophosphate synthase